jgi:hypothetical protein
MLRLMSFRSHCAKAFWDIRIRINFRRKVVLPYEILSRMRQQQYSHVIFYPYFVPDGIVKVKSFKNH